MRAIRLLSLLFVILFASITDAQDEPPVLRLRPEDMGSTFHVATGTVIEVNLEFSDLYIAYDPGKLQFLDYTLPDGMVIGTTESGVVMPDTVNSEPMPMPDDTIGASGAAGGSVGMPNETGAGESAAVVSDVVAAEEGSITSGVVSSGTPSYATWRLRAVAPGETSLSLMTFYPPCLDNQLCPMMPDFLISFDLVIEGSALVIAPESIDAQVIVVTPQQPEATVSVQAGQVVHFEVPALEAPYRVIYYPPAVRLLAGGGLRFVVNPFGMTTRIGAQTSSGELFAASLLVAPECESCGVMPMGGG
jgi:hypothetical protein